MMTSSKNIIRFSLVVWLLVSLILSIMAFALPVGDHALASDSALEISGNKATIGMYPQTIVDDETMIETLNSSATLVSGTKYKYKNEYYTKVEETKIWGEGGGTYSNGQSPINGVTAWFKWEPIKWVILEKDEQNDTVFMVSEYALDVQNWQTAPLSGPQGNPNCYIEGTEILANDWEHSSLRSWLNNEFYNSAFDGDAKSSLIKFTTTAKKSTSKVDTKDYVSLICGSDVDKYKSSKNLKSNASDYAKANYLSYHWHTYDSCFIYVNSLIYEEDTRGYVNYCRGLGVQDGGFSEPVYSENPCNGIRPIITARYSKSDVKLTEEEKEELTQDVMLYVGIAAAIVGAGLALPIMIITSKKQKRSKKENGADYKLTKKEAGILTPGLFLVIGGIVLIVLYVALFGGGFAGIGGAKLTSGVYVQSTSSSSDGNVVQVGSTAYRLNDDGTFNFTGYYDGASTAWDNGGTWKQSGSTVTFVWNGNPMVAAGYTATATIYDGGKSFGSASERFKKIGS